MRLLRADDVISGKEGRAFATIDGSVEDLFFVRQLEAVMRKKKEMIPILGSKADVSKSNGWSGAGAMDIYYVTSVFRGLLDEYNRTGRDIYFDIQVVNEDPSSSSGRQTVVLKNVNLDTALLAKLDIGETVMSESLSFTFDDFEILDSFERSGI